ncbi:MAG TPA: VWA domain-containing protein [Burkholderiales bacterium]|nr:VWA domain-containing protein [Burkholderiales bacterium]
MSFLWPEALLALAALPALALIYLRRPLVRLPGIVVATPSRWRRHLPALIYACALVMTVVASARPTALVTLPSASRTIILVIDVSLSMRASDVQPSRIAAAQAAAREFVRDPPGDVKIGIVSFAGTAALIQQPTRERDELVAAIDRLQLDRHTPIGSGIIVALAALYPNEGIDVESFGPGARPRRNDARPVPPGSNANAAIIMLTDGRRTIGPDPLEAARLAADHGVRVYTVGFGNSQGGPVAFEGYSIYMMFDEETLKAIAQLTNAEYFNASSGAELKTIYDSLTTKFALAREETELTAFFAAAAAALLVLGAGLSALWFSRIL